MNTVKSFWQGMTALMLAGGGAYYFAKKEIEADRREKHLLRQKKQREQNRLIYDSDSGHASPAVEATSDPAPTRHEPQSEEQRVREKSKYEATEVYRSPKGDRFS